eukprot:CAMPEP_0118654422 /NCGR_PEP_ID=MMETSP0785-20121206/12388_1 /TAXON_ID=91992 /ORGANISM="Bolidomonas pacifica, Strain CCMP 1866" /LENGTH=213 /DNA_ID=CAMNT_0006547095 /DNA_START=233 /DNA_END=874 /DNA_ORIENTATION=+
MFANALRNILLLLLIILVAFPTTINGLAGFGSKPPNKSNVLRPKGQWDRYLKFLTTHKKDTTLGYNFGTCVIRTPSSKKWIKVGYVAALPGVDVSDAVMVQKRIIFEHARRLQPGNFVNGGKTDVEWGVLKGRGDGNREDQGGGEDYEEAEVITKFKKVDAGVGEVGFEGMPDPATGFFCKYDKGKIIETGKRSDGEMRITGGKKSGEKRTGL